MRLARWVVLALLVGAGVAFLAELLRPRPDSAPQSGYLPPRPAPDHRVVLPD